MIRTNLSTRPFYNQRAVSLWIGSLALVVAAATVFNLAKVIDYSRNDTTTNNDSPALFPTAKVVAGYDFAGDAYNEGQCPDITVPDAELAPT